MNRSLKNMEVQEEILQHSLSFRLYQWYVIVFTTFCTSTITKCTRTIIAKDSNTFHHSPLHHITNHRCHCYYHRSTILT